MGCIPVWLVFCVVAAYRDIRIRKIPNCLIGIAFVYGCTLAYTQCGVREMISRIIMCLLVGAILYLLYRAGAMGAGDVKLYAIVALFFEKNELIYVYLFIFGVGAVFGMCMIVFTSGFRTRIRNLNEYIRQCFQKGHIYTYQREAPKKVTVPMAVPLAIAVAIITAFEYL